VLFLGSAVSYALACCDVFAGSSKTWLLTERSSNINTMHARPLAMPMDFPINSCPVTGQLPSNQITISTPLDYHGNLLQGVSKFDQLCFGQSLVEHSLPMNK
jgi:hypothetical protein